MKYTIFSRESRAHIIHVINNLDAEKKWSVEITKKTAGRTRSQNALYWRWLSEIAALVSDHTGYEKEEVHELFKTAFLTPKHVNIGGLEVMVSSTKKLTTQEMSEYMDRIDRFCIQNLGISLPIPSEMQLR